MGARVSSINKDNKKKRNRKKEKPTDRAIEKKDLEHKVDRKRSW